MSSFDLKSLRTSVTASAATYDFRVNRITNITSEGTSATTVTFGGDWGTTDYLIPGEGSLNDVRINATYVGFVGPSALTVPYNIRVLGEA